MKKNILHGFLLGLAVVAMSVGSAKATDYTSKASGGSFSDPSTWNQTMSQDAWLAIIQSETHNFEVTSNATVTVDDSLNVNNLTVNGTLVFGDADDKSYTVIVNGTFEVSGVAKVSDYIGAHTLQVAKGFTSTSGEIDFRKGTGQAVNVVLAAGKSKSQDIMVNTGTGKTLFSNLDVASGTAVAGSDLKIKGSLTIDSGAAFDAGDKTITILGNFSKKSDKKDDFKSSGIVVFKGTTVQSISNGGNLHFNNVEISGGGFVVVSNNTYFDGNFEVSENSSVSTSAALYFYKNFLVNAGSKYDSNADHTYFYGDCNQTITMNGDVAFTGVSCNSSSSTIKTFVGSIISTGYLRAFGNSRIEDASASYNHTFVGATVEGEIALKSPMTITGGTLRKSEVSKPAPVYGSFSLGTGDITIRTGEVYVRAGDTFNFSSDITVESGAFVLSGNTERQALLVGDENKNTLSVAYGARFYLRGVNNFPTDCKVVLDDGCTTYYDSQFDQTVKGTHYGNLYLDYFDKTFDGDSYIAGHLYMYPMTNGSSTVYFGDFTHTLGYHFYDNPDRKGTTSILSTGKIILKCSGNHGQTIYKRTTGTYVFNDLIIENDDAINAQTKTLGGEITVNGKLELKNSYTNELLLLTLNMGEYDIKGGSGDNNIIVMGNNTCIRTSGANNFQKMTQAFGDVILNDSSTIQFDGSKYEQIIPTVTYGNIVLNGATAKTIEQTVTINGWIGQSGNSPKLTIRNDNVTVRIHGDWKLAAANLDLNKNAIISFEGDDQEIAGTTLPNVHVRGSGVKTLKGNLTVEGDLKVFSGCELNADNRTINLYGNFENISGGGGQYHQVNGRLNLRGNTDVYQTVECASIDFTRFYDVYIERTKTDTVVFASDIYVGRNLVTAENKGSLDIENHTLTIGGDFDLRRNCKFKHAEGAKLHFNGSEAEQLIRNYNTENIYPTMEFSGSAIKRPYDNTFPIKGDVKINNGAIVATGYKLKVSGTWENLGVFNSSSEVEFDGEMGEGEFQLIGGSTFNNVTFGGKGEKRLGGIINLTGWLKIDSLAILDVSPDGGNTYYGITLAGHWYNDVVSPRGKTGYFEPRQGTVTFVGNSTYLYTGESLDANGNGTDGKKFYNIVINTSDPNNYKGLYPLHGSNARERTGDNDLYVINDLTINTGIFYFYWNRVFVGGNLQNLGGTLSMNSHYEARNKLILGGTGKGHVFDPGPANTIRQLEIVNGGTYRLANSYLQYTTTASEPQDSLINIKNGTLWMKDCDITFYESGGIKIGEKGTLHMDSAAVIGITSGRKILNLGKLELMGHVNSPAKIHPATVDGTYYLIQDGENASFEADQFDIEGTRVNGLDIRKGKIKGLNNGIFSNSTGTALLTISSAVSLGSGLEADNITFDAKNNLPTYNVQRTDGTGAITFKNYGGTLAGETRENDHATKNLIDWKMPNGCVWTGDGTNNRWHNPDNWANHKVPTKDSVVILNHLRRPGAYTIIVDERAEVLNLTIDSDVTLDLKGVKNDGKDDGLRVYGKLTMMTGSTLKQNDAACDSLILNGSWSCSGTYAHNNVPVVFDLGEGSYQLTMGNTTNIGALVIRSDHDGSLSLSSSITVIDSVRLESGTFYGNTAQISLKGDWIAAGGVFAEGESIVDFCGDGEEQFVKGGRFWEIRFEKSAPKTITKDIVVNRMFRIMDNSAHVAAYKNIYMAGRTTYWYNYVGEEVFEQTGDASVIFTGGSASIGYVNKGIVQTKPTVFNNLIIQGTSTKYIRDITKIKGTFEMMANTDVQIDRTGYIIGAEESYGLGARAFTAYGGALVVYGRDNFPLDMDVSLYAGTVYYRDSSLYQIVRGVEYNNLYLYNYYFTTNSLKDYSTKKLEGDIAVKGSLYIYDSITTLDVRDKTITLTGNLSLAENGKQIVWGDNGKIVHVGGNWEVDTDIKVLNNVEKKGTGILYQNSNLTVKGDIEFDPETKLYMRGYKMTGNGGNFKMGTNCQLHSAVVKGEENDVALPTNFGTFELDSTTYTYLEAAADQILPSNVTYGIVYLNNTASRTVYLNGETTIKGNFYNNQDGTVLDDQGYNLHLYGESNDLRNYRPTTTTVFFERGDFQKVYAGGGYTELYLNNIVLNGSGVKEIDETTIKIGGNITIGANTSFSCDNIVEFSGDVIVNNGTFRHYANTFTFTGKKQHTINMGEDNIFNSFSLVDADTVTIVGNGITVYTGVFSLGKDAKLDMGEFTHNIASSKIDLGTGCKWITENANLIFNRAGNQTIPALECRNIRFSTSSTKTLAGKLIADTLKIDEGVTFSVGSDASKSNSITIYGDWICDGSFTSHNDTVFFESKEKCAERKIKSNEQWFSDLVFHRNTILDEGDTTIFKLQDKVMLKNNMEIDTCAAVCLNKNTLVIGNDDTNLTGDNVYPDGEMITVNKGGELRIDAGGTLQFDHLDGYPRLDVKGKLTMVGSEKANAVITRSSSKHDTHGTMITIYKGGMLAANFYQVQYLAPTGFVIENGAIIDDINNLSNGIWSNMYTSYNYKDPFQSNDSKKIDTLIYLTVNVDEMVNPIVNLAFNHGGTPTVGHHFNIMRDTLLPNSITLDGVINGAMGFIEYQRFHYKGDNPKNATVDRNIIWPPVQQIEWTGLVSQNWHDKRNWLPMTLPDTTLSVKIPMKSNAPIIYRPGAQCKNLTITNGSLTIEDAAKSADKPALYVKGTVEVQNGGVFAIDGTADVEVHGDWNIAKKGYFVPQNGTVVFAAEGGSVSVVPRNSEFNNVTFKGQATYMFMDSPININGDFTVNSGLVWPATADYNYNIAGNYYIDAEHGGFNKDVTGYVNFVGSGDQTIENGQFNRVRFSNAGEKILSGNFDAIYNSSTRTARTIIVQDNAVMKAADGCKLNIKGNVFIDSNASFDDGGETHTFTGYYWEGLGEYEGAGTIKFNANHGQYIWGGKFHNVDMTLNTKYISGNVEMDGNLKLESCTLDMLTNHISSTGTFIMGEKSNVYARGDDNYPSFKKYEITGTSCYSYYSGPMNQTIRAAKYGYLYLNSNTTKTLEGDITVLKDLYFYENGGTLVANNKNIYVGQHWKNQYTGKFVPGTGRVIFNGSNGNQYVYLGVSTENPFYEIEIDKPEGQQFYASSVDLSIGASLYVTSGKMHCVSGYKVTIGGNVMVGGSGIISQSGHYVLTHNSGECSIQTNGSILNDLTLNGNCTFKLSDDLTVYGNFTLQKGTFNQNRHVATLGNSLDNIAIYGTYKVTAGGKLRIGDATSLVVKDGGVFEALGTESEYALITNNSGRYYFTVESGGLIKANYYNFSFLAKQGLIISDGADIDGELNFSNGVFSNVVSGGVCLDIRNKQHMYGEDREGKIKNISFPNNPGGGAVNIRKVESATGKIEVYNATGLLAGELYENDPHGIIEWKGDVEYIWTGKNSEDWWDSGNWIAKLNGAITGNSFPSADNNVVIPSTTAGSGRYPMITRDSAFAKRLTIEKNAELKIAINTEDADSIRHALTATSDVTVEGTLIMNSDIDTLNVLGNWVVGTAGKLTVSNGTVVMSGVGVKTIQNRAQAFNNLVIDNLGTMQAQSAMTVGGNFIINQGVFDVTSYDVTVGGSYVNNGTFVPQSKTLILAGTAPLPLEGYHTFNPGSNAYYNVTVKGGTYSLNDNELFVNRTLDINGGALNVMSNVMNIGDGTGVDNVNITGTLNLQSDGKLKMGNNAVINVNSTGTLSMVGGLNHEAIVTSQNVNGTYSFNVYGNIAAKYYKVERVNSSGLHLYADAKIDRDNNLSNGQYVSGAPGGRYIWFENNYGTAEDDSTFTISNVYFNAGPRYNATRDNDATNGIVAFVDAVGVAASYYFEEDDGKPNTGAIRWKYTGTVLQWVGGDNMVIEGVEHDPNRNRWDNPNNWINMETESPASPSKETELHIYEVAEDYYPVIYSDDNTVDVDGYVKAKGITLYKGSSLTLNEGNQLKVENTKSGLIIGKNATFTAYDSVFIKGQFSNAGTFDHGNKSTIVWQSSLNRDIEMNGCPFYNFIVKNEGDATVTFSVEPGKSLVVKKDFTIESGTVNCNGGILEVGGDFTNKAGEFLHGKGTVKLNGTSSQILKSENGLLSFYNLELIESGEKEIHNSISVAKTITVGTTVRALDDVDIYCQGDWKRPQSSEAANDFEGGSGAVIFNGNALQTIGKPESFTHFVVNNNSSASAISTTYSQTITKELQLKKGIFTTSNPILLGADAVMTDYSEESYINGAVHKLKHVAVDSIFFPIGGSDRYAPIAICRVKNDTGVYQVSYHSEQPNNRESLQAGLNKVSKSEYWTLDYEEGSAVPHVLISWRDREFSGLKDLDVASVALYTGGKWERQGETDLAKDLFPIDKDSLMGYLISHDAVSAPGKITFGFSYPTLHWLPTAATNVYATKTNWDPNKYKVDDGVNISVTEIDGNYPTVFEKGECYDLTIGPSGKLKVADNQTLTVYGEAKIEGTLELGVGATIVFMQDVDAVNATVVAENGSTVVIGGDIEQNWSLSSCQNLVIQNGGSNSKLKKTLTSNVDVNGSISINELSQLNAVGKTINLKGDFTINSAGDFIGNSTLVMCGDAKQKLAITPNKPLCNLTIANTYSSARESGVDLGTGIVVTGHLKLEQGIIRSTSKARLALSTTATTSGANSKSFVIGEMQKDGKADFVFPIGSEAHGLAQLGVYGLTDAAYLVAEYVTAMPPLVRSLQEPIQKVSWLESWHIGNENTTHAQIELYWSDSSYSQIWKPRELLVAAYQNGQWESLGMSDVHFSDDSSGYIRSKEKVLISGQYKVPRAAKRQSTNRNLKTAAPRALAGNNGVTVTFATENPSANPLPIELYSFDATATPNNDVKLNWSTASEHNNAYFTIEHMFDGKSEVVDTVEAKGLSDEGASYSYLHVNQPVGTHYYRLHQTDFDGVTKVASDWVSVTIEADNQAQVLMSVVPNPGRCQDMKFTVSGIVGNSLRYVVADMSGQTIIDNTIGVAGMSTIQIEATDWNLQPSMYLIKVFTDNGQTVSKFVVE
ncbi:MAG: T9SS type A sorting domain-containing protein [Salinivirgaceae bacterium]|nr:T9SS type A sorting domain-containing protein [Salinivirgaceae bacterium]